MVVQLLPTANAGGKTVRGSGSMSAWSLVGSFMATRLMPLSLLLNQYSWPLLLRRSQAVLPSANAALPRLRISSV